MLRCDQGLLIPLNYIISQLQSIKWTSVLLVYLYDRVLLYNLGLVWNSWFSYLNPKVFTTMPGFFPVRICMCTHMYVLMCAHPFTHMPLKTRLCAT